MWKVEIKLKFFERGDSSLNYRSIFPAQDFILFLFVYECMRDMCVQVPNKDNRVLDFFRIGITGDCDLLDMDAGNQILIP